MKFDQHESGEAAFLLSSGIGSVGGLSAFSQHVHRFVFRDGLCAKVHLSSTTAGEAVANQLMQAVGTMTIVALSNDIARTFYLSPKKAMRLTMPHHWGFETSQPSMGPSRRVTMSTPDGQFQFMVTFLLAPSEQNTPAATFTRNAMEKQRDQVASSAVETSIDIKPLKGRSAEGHFFFATDKNRVGKPAMPNNWLYMRQGMLSVGAAFVTFSVYSNDVNSPDALQAMRALEDIAFILE